jgi:hypothetical protein
MRSAHCLSMRRWTLNGYTILIGPTLLKRLRASTCCINLSTNFAFASPDGSAECANDRQWIGMSVLMAARACEDRSARIPSVCFPPVHPVDAAHTIVPNKAPTAAVSPMANAPQNVTRSAPTATPAPPAPAASAPKSARKSREVPGTRIIRLACGTKAVVKRGVAAPTAKLSADANAA